MTLRIEAGFNFTSIGSATMSVVEASAAGTSSVTLSSGRYTHTAIASVDTAFTGALATAVQSQLNSNSSGGHTYTVTFNSTTLAYTISVSAGTFAVTWSGASNTRMKQLLGFSSNISATASATSDVRPYYLLSGAMGGMSAKTDDYELDGYAASAFAEGGTHYSIKAGTFPIGFDFTVPMEAKATTFTRSATASVPWTYQHFVQHARNTETCMVYDGTESTVFRLQDSAARFAPARVVPDWDDLWNWPMRCYLIGRL